MGLSLKHLLRRVAFVLLENTASTNRVFVKTASLVPSAMHSAVARVLGVLQGVTHATFLRQNVCLVRRRPSVRKALLHVFPART
jgi:hypothetical protein